MVRCKSCGKKIEFEDKFEENPEDKHYTIVESGDEEFVDKVEHFFDSFECLLDYEVGGNNG